MFDPKSNPNTMLLGEITIFDSISLHMYLQLVQVKTHAITEECNEDVWIVIGNDKNGGPKVYDVTNYLDDHPGGREVMIDLAGKNADELFEDIGHSHEARKIMQKYMIGELLMTVGQD